MSSREASLHYMAADVQSHRDKAKQFYNLERKCRMRGLIDEAHNHLRSMDEANQMAVKLLMERSNTMPGGVYDCFNMHGLRTEEAASCLDEALDSRIQRCRHFGMYRQSLWVNTGHGRNRGRPSKLKECTLQHLANRNLSLHDYKSDDGVLNVIIDEHSKLSSELVVYEPRHSWSLAD